MHIGTVRGIKVNIHWTFWILIAAYLLPVLSQSGWSATLSAGAFIGGVFACVVAHEFGHAAAAGYYGIPTADITLLPIGGVARLTRLPEKPMQELVVALAGPAVNVVIAAGLWAFYAAGMAVGGRAPALGLEMDLIAQLIAANIFLCAFNLLPAFPMDGGRVLRGLLAMRTTHLRATQIAARVGRWMALVFLVLGLLYSFSLVLVAGFIFFAGTAELMQVRFREAARQSREGGSPFDTAAGQAGAGPAGYGQAGVGGNGQPWFVRTWPNQDHYGQQEGYRETDAASSPGSDDVIEAVDVRRINDDSDR
ncbi:MAG: site-2 protease family protein [Pirellulaceae bacterium]